MLDSVESVSMISLPDISFPQEPNIVSLDCWQDICLSNIWLPRHLLTNRRKPSNALATQGIFHTLEKRGHAKQIESFSAYSDSDNEADVFLSDSDDAFDLDSISSDKVREEKEGEKFIGKTENVLKPFQSCKEDKKENSISLHDILNCTTEVDISKFEFKKDHKHRNKQEETVKSNKKNKNDKKKNKVTKSVTLDKFLEDYTDANKQEDYANDYLRKLLMSQNKGGKVELKNNYEFPTLTSKEVQFMHQEKPATEKSEISMKTLTKLLTRSDKTENDNIVTSHSETIASEQESAVEKIVIENIPPEVCRDDIFALLCGYGEVKDFSLEPDGDFLKAFVILDLVGDIDWITECLNGTEPFGASTRVLRCYKQ